VSCPNVGRGAWRSATEPAEDRAPHRRRARPDPAPGHRQAHAERHRTSCPWARAAAGRRRRRGVAGQHAAGAGARSPESRAVPGQPHRRGCADPRSSPSPCAWSGRSPAPLEVPIIGMGGIVTGLDALEFVACGATAVAVGAANFTEPAAARRIVRRALRRDGQARPGRPRGRARPRARARLAARSTGARPCGGQRDSAASVAIFGKRSVGLRWIRLARGWDRPGCWPR